MKNNDRHYMDRCLELAALAAAEGESAVGSVIVSGGEIVGEGSEQSKRLRDVTRHAEVVAVLDALKHVKSLAGATLYTNVEPCIVCSYVIRHHRIGKVVFLKKSGELGGTHKPYNILTAADIQSWNKPPIVEMVDMEK